MIRLLTVVLASGVLFHVVGCVGPAAPAAAPTPAPMPAPTPPAVTEPEKSVLERFKGKPTNLKDAVEAFNEEARNDATGKSQPPLTEDEVVAAIRGWIRGDHPPVRDAVFQDFQRIAETGKLPLGAELTFLNHWAVFNKHEFDVWWVDLTILYEAKDGKGIGYTFRVRDQKLRSTPADS